MRKNKINLRNFMNHGQIYSRFLWIILIGAATVGANFAQSPNGDARKRFRRDRAAVDH